MGYTHYWYRREVLNKETFIKFSEDCKKIFDYCINDLGIDLDGCFRFEGQGPVANEDCIWFNGSDEQRPGVWTTEEDLTIPWPSPTASLTEPVVFGEKTNGEWYAGNIVEQRVAPLNNLTGKGEGSYETFGINRIQKRREWEDPKKPVFTFCKTAYRPYDLTVTAVLIAFKHHFPTVKISSDGSDKDWIDGQFLCNNLLGYGLDFKLKS